MTTTSKFYRRYLPTRSSYGCDTVCENFPKIGIGNTVNYVKRVYFIESSSVNPILLDRYTSENRIFGLDISNPDGAFIYTPVSGSI